jgi:hypothetical protein
VADHPTVRADAALIEGGGGAELRRKRNDLCQRQSGENRTKAEGAVYCLINTFAGTIGVYGGRGASPTSTARLCPPRTSAASPSERGRENVMFVREPDGSCERADCFCFGIDAHHRARPRSRSRSCVN